MGLVRILTSFLDAAGSRVLASLGIGIVTFGAVSVTVDGLVTQLTTAWGGVTGVSLQVLSLAGIPQALGMIVGALVARVALQFLPKFGLIS